MKNFILIAIILVQFSIVFAANVSMPEKYKVHEKTLVLNGTGVRHKWVDLYTAGLYLNSKNQNAEEVINGNETMIIRINVISKLITSSRLEEAMRSEISRVTNGKIEPYKERIEQLVKAFHGGIKKGDNFDLVYTPEAGLTVYKNNEAQTSIQGLDFKKVIYSTWLGSDPMDESLRNGMLGK